MDTNESPAPAREEGEVLSWLTGYGFIKPDQGRTGRDVFCHYSEIRLGPKRLEAGQRVRFTRGQDERGRTRAMNVVPDIGGDS